MNRDEFITEVICRSGEDIAEFFRPGAARTLVGVACLQSIEVLHSRLEQIERHLAGPDVFKIENLSPETLQEIRSMRPARGKIFLDAEEPK